MQPARYEGRSRACSSSAQLALFTIPFWLQARTQIAVFIFFAFCTLGPYNGLNALGGGGLNDHLLATKINCIYAISLAILGWLGGAAFSYFGCRIVCCVSGLCYLSYVMVLLSITFGNASAYWVYPTGVCLGLGASLLWASFGAISIRYSVHRPRTFAIMWCLTNLGGFACGLASLAINFSSEHHSSEASFVSYVVLSLAVLSGTLCAALGLRHQNEVFRSDGEQAGNSTSTSLINTLWNAACVFRDRRVMPLWPIFLAPFAHMPFLFNGLNGQYFNIRSRSLNSSIYWFSRVPGGIIFFFVSKQPGPALADGKVCVARRLMPGFYVTFAWASVCLAFSHFSIFNSFGITPPPDQPHERMDFSRNWPSSLLPMIPFMSFGILDALVQSLREAVSTAFSASLSFSVYNLLGSLAGTDSKQAALYSGFYKSMQSITVGLVWGVDWILTTHEHRLPYSTRYKIHWWVMCLSWTCAFPGTLRQMLRIRKMPNQVSTSQGGVGKLPELEEESTIVSSSGGVISVGSNFPCRPVVRPALVVSVSNK